MPRTKTAHSGTIPFTVPNYHPHPHTHPNANSGKRNEGGENKSESDRDAVVSGRNF